HPRATRWPIQPGEGRRVSERVYSQMTIGFFGKLASHGDFVTRDLADDFVGRWDEWLSAGLSAYMEHSDWEARFERAPAWRFALCAGGCGQAGMLGVFLPSHDSVGRRFPFTVALGLPTHSRPFRQALAAADWFNSIESAACGIAASPPPELVSVQHLIAEAG